MDLVYGGEQSGVIVGATARDIADAISQYHKDRSLADLHGRNGRAKAVARYSSSSILSQHLDLFRRAIDGSV